MRHLKHNRGLTLIETLTASLLITILMTMLIRGVLTASNWYAESEVTKMQGEAVANNIEGRADGAVTTEVSQGDFTLSKEEGTENVGLRDDVSTINSYSVSEYDSTITMKTIKTDVPDVNQEIKKDKVYQPTLDSQAKLQETVQGIMDDYKNIIGNNSYNNSQLNAYLQSHDGYETISDEFVAKYNLDAYSGQNELSTPLYIRPYMYGKDDVLYYAAIGNNNTNNPWRVFLIYDPDSMCWYVCPRRALTDTTFYKRYCNFTITKNNNLPIYTGCEKDDLGITHVLEASGDKVHVKGSADILAYIKNEANGWIRLVPDM